MFEVFKIVKILEIAKEILWEKSRWRSCGSLERHALAKGLSKILDFWYQKWNFQVILYR